MKEIYEMKERGPLHPRHCWRPGVITQNTVRRYLNSSEAIGPKPRPQRTSKLDPYREHVDRRLSEGLENCVV